MLKRFLLSAVLIGSTLGVVTPPAMARDRDDYRHERRDRERHERQERRERDRRERRFREHERRERWEHRYNNRRSYYNRGYGYYDRFGFWHPYR